MKRICGKAGADSDQGEDVKIEDDGGKQTGPSMMDSNESQQIKPMLSTTYSNFSSFIDLMKFLLKNPFDLNE